MGQAGHADHLFLKKKNSIFEVNVLYFLTRSKGRGSNSFRSLADAFAKKELGTFAHCLCASQFVGLH
jgi:hypothetical protein